MRYQRSALANEPWIRLIIGLLPRSRSARACACRRFVAKRLRNRPAIGSSLTPVAGYISALVAAPILVIFQETVSRKPVAVIPLAGAIGALAAASPCRGCVQRGSQRGRLAFVSRSRASARIEEYSGCCPESSLADCEAD
jgi:hypothetical protein